ncbi:tRNA(Thr) (cytosine(32)-N(3))-methyltransferase [Pichia kluyveri]|uniref:tRNA N(3)-methylcytidine methyltransferase n=1 Tax=Pichia kluyveri TaxID=36015 RepID=A0AAV5RCI7_PICKL|nr:tRNA(Thr) (cytosine(32)-N(3))-methyltransferase [Pichia kluyveri]
MESKPSLDTRLGRDDPFSFGQRTLTNEEEVFTQNAWDNVEWDEEQFNQFLKNIENQKNNPVNEFNQIEFNSKPKKYWDLFYKNNQVNFFKDRKWLEIEFPEIFKCLKEDAGEKTILEIGCGVGNTMYPILEKNKNPKLRVFGCDYSDVAVELVRSNENFELLNKSGNAFSSVWDLANEEGEIPADMEENSVDIAVMIFVFSALNPKQWETAMKNLRKVLKPNGIILFRDYGRYDLAQIRFKKNRYLEDNFYVRGDGTRVYFFTEEELRDIFVNKGGFKEEKIGTDKRLLINRKKQLKMYRCWLQAVFKV